MYYIKIEKEAYDSMVIELAALRLFKKNTLDKLVEEQKQTDNEETKKQKKK